MRATRFVIFFCWNDFSMANV